MNKFNRNFTLYVEASVEEGGGTVIIQPPFTIDFDINRNNLAASNTAAITIYNLSKKTRDQIYKDQYDTNIYRGIELWAGYGTALPTSLQAAFKTPVLARVAAEQAQLFPRVFRGNAKQISSARPKTDFLTTIEAYDGGFAKVNGQVSQPYLSGTPKSEIISKLIGGLPGITVGAIGDFPGDIPRGNTFLGDPVQAILGLTGGNFYIDGEKAYCLNDNEYIQGSVPVISSATGLIGVPRKQRTIVTVDMIFEPGLTISQGVELNCRTNTKLNGFYKVTGLQHRGTISESVCGVAITTAQLQNNETIMDLVSHR